MGNTSGMKAQAPPPAAVGLGLAALGRPGYINLGHDADLGADRSVEGMRQHAHEVLDAAWRLGIRYIDVARSYGLAERFLATWLELRPEAREELRIGSKWGYAYTAGWRVDAEEHEVKEHSLEQLRLQYRETCAELGRPPDLYQIHSVTPDSPVLDDVAVLTELAALRERGVAIGLTTSGPRQSEVVERMMGVEVDRQPLFSSVQVTWNILERSVEVSAQAAHTAGVRVIVKEALANGRLTSRGEARIVRPLQEHAEAIGATVDAVAIAAVRSRPWVDTALSGAATVAQLESNVAAAPLAVSDDDLRRWPTLVEDPATYWAHRSRLPWT
jgi:aryl-alcohol dehydrogenase-like predicted oxidoreductase